MTVTASVTEQLAEWIVNAQYEDVPDPGALRVKERFIDSLGVQFAGLSVSTGQIISQWVRAQGAKEESSVVGAGFKSTGVVGHARQCHGRTRSRVRRHRAVQRSVRQSADGGRPGRRGEARRVRDGR